MHKFDIKLELHPCSRALFHAITMKSLTKKSVLVAPDYAWNYIEQAGEGNLLEELEFGGVSPYMENSELLEKIGHQTYAPGKWTVPQIIEHLIDAERVFQYRALRIARQDKTPLEGFDHDMWVAISKANDRTLEDLLEEMQIVRMASYSLFKSFDSDQLFFTGTTNGQANSVIALGFMMIGHPIHHYKVIQERYSKLAE